MVLLLALPWQRPGHGATPTTPYLIRVQQRASEAEAWLRAFAERWHFNYDEMIAGGLEEEGYVVAMGRDLHYASELDPGDEEAFWRNIQILTGKKFDPVHRQRFGWSCSC